MVDQPRRVEVSAEEYDARWARLAAAGEDVHGEADLVELLLEARDDAPAFARNRSARRGAVLDAGCGTGRVARELHDRGFATVGVDADPALLARAREQAPRLPWVEADLADLGPGVAPGPFDSVVLAGNVMIFLTPGTEGAVLADLAHRLAPGGLLIAGFQLLPDRLPLDRYDELVQRVGLVPVARWSTWQRDRFAPDSRYVVAVDEREHGPFR